MSEALDALAQRARLKLDPTAYANGRYEIRVLTGQDREVFRAEGNVVTAHRVEQQVREWLLSGGTKANPAMYTSRTGCPFSLGTLLDAPVALLADFAGQDEAEFLADVDLWASGAGLPFGLRVDLNAGTIQQVSVRPIDRRREGPTMSEDLIREPITVDRSFDDYLVRFSVALRGRAGQLFAERCGAIVDAYIDEKESDFFTSVGSEPGSLTEIEFVAPREFMTERDPRAFRRALEDAAREAAALGAVAERQDDVVAEEWLDAFREG